MPKVSDFTDEKEWMAACVPVRLKEGDEQDQAVAACMTMWRDKDKPAEDESTDSEAPTTDAVKAVDLGGTWQDALKVGARNSGTDQERLQVIHDYSVQNGAACSPATPGGKSVTLDPDSMIAFGDAVKAVDLGGGKVKVTGYLLRFGTAKDPDLTGDFFDKKTDFAFNFPGQSHTWFNHRLPVSTKRGPMTISDRFDPASLSVDDVGVLLEGILDERKAYDAMLIKLGRAGKLGLSSGTAGHLVKRTAQGNASHIDVWPLGLDASYTHTPAEHRNTAVVSLKSLTTPSVELDEVPEAASKTASAPIQAASGATIKTIQNQPQENTMSDEQLTALTTQIKTLGDEVTGLKTIIAAAPPIKTVGTGIEVTLDEADRPFKSLAENITAVKMWTLTNGRNEHPRLTHPALKAATGSNETVPSDGAFLLDPTLTGEILMPMHEEGPFTSRVRRLTVGNNSNYGWINGVDETDRANGSRWGGITGYRLAEAGTKTPSMPKFRRITWELKKYAVYCYATDELLQDVTQFSQIVRMGASEELSFMANDDILNGNGVGGPVGILTGQNPALVTVTKLSQQANDTIVLENLLAMWKRMPTRNKANAIWFYNGECSDQLDTLALAVGTAALEPRFVRYSDAGVMTIKGRPAIETEFNPGLGDAGDICLIDPNEYLFWEKGGVQEATSIHVAFVTDQTVLRLITRVEGKPAVSAPITPYKGTSSTLSPFVALGAR